MNQKKSNKREIPNCHCRWCSDEDEDYAERQPEYLLTCSGPFIESQEVHGLCLYVLELEARLSKYESKEIE